MSSFTVMEDSFDLSPRPEEEVKLRVRCRIPDCRTTLRGSGWVMY